MRIPTATYRIQFTPLFGFPQAEQQISYLKKLGISDVYASPVFKSRKNSAHGYDVIDPTCLNPELGTEHDFTSLLKEVKGNSMGWIQDIVPNHMAFDGQNSWLMDVFEKGKASQYWRIFDIEWKDTYQSLRGKVLAPFLGKFYSRCLEDKEIQLRYSGGTIAAVYYDLAFPLKISTYPDVLLFEIKKLERVLGKRSKTYLKYRGILKNLERNNLNKGVLSDNHYQSAKKQIWEMYRGNANVKKHINQNLKIFNGQKGNPGTFQLLDNLLSRQFFRLSFWKFGSEEINYRRFFNINQLISVKVENRKVFEKTHEMILKMAREKTFSGLRVDHIDGLNDPKKYLQRLRNSLKDHYIVVEKILEGAEPLPVSWPIEGTTGYEFMNYVNRVFVDDKNEMAMKEIYQKNLKNDMSFGDLVSAKKRLILGKHMAGDIDNLAHHMKKISHKDRYGRDISYYGLKRALVEVLALFPRYRTYIDGEFISREDHHVIKETIFQAKEENPGLVYELDFIENILLLNFKDHLTVKEKADWVHFVKRFQQFTGPLMAKGFEDTTLYIYNRLISLNEVGGNPEHFGILLKDFHQFNHIRQTRWPVAMNATATHDTKRGEDARARINVLSEIPEQWNKKITRWHKINENKKVFVHGQPAPDQNDEYFLYQTLVGGYPFEDHRHANFKTRLKEYAIKAVREAKIHTAWIQPDEKYENAYRLFIDRILKESETNLFLKDFRGFKEYAAHYGAFNSLSQTLIKMTAPGVPDFYQGSELWDFSFVDPDNRRPVDFNKREKFLEEIQKKSARDNPGLIRELLKRKEDGQIKMYLMWKMLELRNRNKEIFQSGQHISLETAGEYKNNIIAYARIIKNRAAVIIAPRFLTYVTGRNKIPVGGVWKNTKVIMPRDGQWKEGIAAAAFTKKTLYIKDIFKFFPGAVLISSNSDY